MLERAEKWAKKLSGSVRKQRIDAQKPQMVRLEKEATEHLVAIELAVKELARGEPLVHLPYYIIFGKELYRLSKTYSSEAWINEAEVLEEKWRARGLNMDVLQKIKEFYLQSYKNWQHFKLDISELDGPHRLG